MSPFEELKAKVLELAAMTEDSDTISITTAFMAAYEKGGEQAILELQARQRRERQLRGIDSE